MIACGVIKATQNKMRPYAVTLPVDADCKHNVSFFVGNPETIPFYQRRNMDAGLDTAGAFEFVPADQFAEFIPTEDLIREK